MSIHIAFRTWVWSNKTYVFVQAVHPCADLLTRLILKFFDSQYFMRTNGEFYIQVFLDCNMLSRY